MKYAAIYSRQSKDKKDSLSIEAQIEKCASLCAYKGKEYKIYSDKAYSGKNLDRPAFEEMFVDIKSGLIDEVIVYRLDRISRNLNDFTNMVKEFEKYGVTFASTTESFDTSTPMGRAMMYLLAVFSQLERENTAERIKDNAMYRATLGRWNGGTVPLGYTPIKTIDNNRKKTVLEINEDEVEIVKNIFNWYLEPTASIRSVATKLNSLGIKTKTGVDWCQSRISHVLQNVFYATNTPEVYEYFKENDLNLTMINELEEYTGNNGMMYYRKRSEAYKKRRGIKEQEQFIIIGEHKGIIPGKQWVEIQEKISRNKSYTDRINLGRKNIFTGLVRCGICGSSMNIFGAKQYLYFKCKRKEDRGTFLCSNKAVRADKLEAEIVNRVLKLCENQGKLYELLNKDNRTNKIDDKKIDLQIEDIKKSIKIKEDEQNTLLTHLKQSSNIKLLALLEKEFDDINSKLESYNSELKKLLEKKKYLSSKKANKDVLLENYKKFKKEFNKASFEEQKILIRGIIQKVTITNKKVDITYFK